jgi:MFS family permease
MLIDLSFPVYSCLFPFLSYPIMMNVTAAVIDPELAGGAIGYIAALGQCGSAVFPWITGALAGRYGVWALQRESSGSFALAVVKGAICKAVC